MPLHTQEEEIPFVIKPDLLSNIEEITGKEDKKEKTKRYTLLIIEDNVDVRFYIKSQLSDHFTVKEASDGVEGWEMVLKIIPDLVICDIMIPQRSGIELCKLLKEDMRTSHIPVILLTARTTLLQIKEGLELGADDYITKPFNADLLKVRVDNLIHNRERLRQSFGRKVTVENILPENPSLEDQFMVKVYTYIKENLDNPDFSIDTFSAEIGMSRTQFYRKVKALTNMSPSKLVLDLKMKAAASMLRNERLTVSETSYRIGFSDPSYFSKCFKAYFNMSPTEYAEIQEIPQ
ncbi:MAG: response regulator [Bacteroides sp.]|nr:response regulator [Bacteroides sp.]